MTPKPPATSNVLGSTQTCEFVDDVYRGHTGTRSLGPGCDGRQLMIEIFEDDRFAQALHEKLDREIERMREVAARLREGGDEGRDPRLGREGLADRVRDEMSDLRRQERE